MSEIDIGLSQDCERVLLATCGDCIVSCCIRDIKLENTLLDGSKRLVKITDFGYAKSNIDSMPISNVGTPNYAGKDRRCSK